MTNTLKCNLVRVYIPGVKMFNFNFMSDDGENVMTKRKPVVNYRDSIHQRIELGHPAIVFPTNHYATDRVSNTKEVITSPVTSIHRDSELKVSEFETFNTIYRRV